METKLARIAKIAKEKPKVKFTTLYHLLNEELLTKCHRELDGNKAAGIDEITKTEYEVNLVDNIKDLVSRLKTMSHRPQPVRRVYVPKDEKEDRPLGIPAYEDKIIQLGLKKILEAIYEQDFLNVSFGFRPGRSCHDALKELNRTIEHERTNYIVDADIRSFFTTVDHEWLIKFLEARVADPKIIRLIKRFLKAGVVENETRIPTEMGTPQGSILSPLLANVYLHYVLDLWFKVKIEKKLKGKATIIRYCDDFVCCFQLKKEADTFYKDLVVRLAKFKLQSAEEKTKVIMFGRFAEENCKKWYGKKPETFNFLGFTHYCGKSEKGWFRVKRKTSRKKFKAKVKAFNQWLKRNRHWDIQELMDKIRIALLGHFRYYGVTDNSYSLSEFKHRIIRLLFKWLNRRSQRNSYTNEKFRLFLKRHPLPNPKIYVNIYG
jgi:RNA-directed DNA polymerase